MWCREQFDLFRFKDVYLALPKGITPDTSDSPVVCHTTPAEKVSFGFAPSRGIPLEWLKAYVHCVSRKAKRVAGCEGMSLQFTFRGLRVGIPRLPGMLFDFTISNPNARISTVWSYNFELYQVLDSANEIRFLGPLVANLVNPPEWLYDFPQSEQRACELVWNYKREDIQKVEDVRRDDVHFEIKGNLLVASDYKRSSP